MLLNAPNINIQTSAVVHTIILMHKQAQYLQEIDKYDLMNKNIVCSKMKLWFIIVSDHDIEKHHEYNLVECSHSTDKGMDS